MSDEEDDMDKETMGKKVRRSPRMRKGMSKRRRRMRIRRRRT